MKLRKFVLASVSLVLLLPLLFSAGLGGTLAVSAHANGQALCRRVFLPAVMGGAGAASSTEVSAAVLAPSVLQAQNATCAGFPDFNGDGFADLALGVPHKEVFDGIVNHVDAGIVQVVYGSPAGLNAVAGEAAVEDQIWHRALGGVAAIGGDNYGASLAMGDFDSDGYDDLAIGIPGARIDGLDNAGAVQVIYGSASGLTVAGIEEWSRGNGSLDGPAAADEAFGASLATGNFDGDSYADLAIGVPYAGVNGDAEAGGVHILYGLSLGLGQLGNEWLTQDTSGFLPSPAEPLDRFGLALAAGDFDGDSVDDLAVGTPDENNGDDFVDAGAVQIFYGNTGNTAGASGLIRFGSVVDPQHWTADSPDVDGAMEPEDGFGFALATADFNGDGYADLAVGIPFEVHGAGGGALTFGGAINVIHGSDTGLAATPAFPARIWHQDVADMEDEVAQGEFFGYALAAADFDNDGYADLAIGVPGNRTLGVAIGTAHLMYGTSIGLTATGDGLIYDPVNPAANDSFGWTVSAGDFDGDGFTDLAVGAYRDDPLGVAASNPGSVFTFYSGSTGVEQTVHQNWYPGHNGLKGSPVIDDYYGSALPGSPLKP